jgi:hypothetical protein
MSPEKLVTHEPIAVKRDPEDIKEGISGWAEESKEKLRRSGMTKGTKKALTTNFYSFLIPRTLLNLV